MSRRLSENCRTLSWHFMALLRHFTTNSVTWARRRKCHNIVGNCHDMSIVISLSEIVVTFRKLSWGLFPVPFLASSFDLRRDKMVMERSLRSDQIEYSEYATPDTSPLLRHTELGGDVPDGGLLSLVWKKKQQIGHRYHLNAEANVGKKLDFAAHGLYRCFSLVLPSLWFCFWFLFLLSSFFQLCAPSLSLSLSLSLILSISSLLHLQFSYICLWQQPLLLPPKLLKITFLQGFYSKPWDFPERQKRVAPENPVFLW